MDGSPNFTEVAIFGIIIDVNRRKNMALTKENKKSTIERFKGHTTDTGSPSVQIALLTERINQLTQHFKAHGKDFASRQGLLKLVGNRRRLLNYLRSTDNSKYRQLIEELNLRR